MSPRLAVPAMACISPPEILPEAVWAATQCYLDDPQGPPSGELRLFRNGTLAPVTAETLTDFRDNPLESLIFLNHAERWMGSEFISLREWFRGLDPTFPPHIYEKELHLIAGSYSGTPFGAHVDSVLERSLHFNLGPGSKTFLLWAPEVYIGLTGGKAASQDLDTLAPHAQRFRLQAGQTMILPETPYHIAVDCENSVTLAVTLRRRTTLQTAVEVLKYGLAIMADSAGPTPVGFDAPLAPLFSSTSEVALWSEPLASHAKIWYEKWRYQVHAASGFADNPHD